MTSAKNLGFVRLFGLGVVLALSVRLVSGIGRAQETGGTYTNPVSKGFADPSIIKANDGYWYSYETSYPPREGRTHVNPTVLALQI